MRWLMRRARHVLVVAELDLQGSAAVLWDKEAVTMTS